MAVAEKLPRRGGCEPGRRRRSPDRFRSRLQLPVEPKRRSRSRRRGGGLGPSSGAAGVQPACGPACRALQHRGDPPVARTAPRGARIHKRRAGNRRDCPLDGDLARLRRGGVADVASPSRWARGLRVSLLPNRFRYSSRHDPAAVLCRRPARPFRSGERCRQASAGWRHRDRAG